MDLECAEPFASNYGTPGWRRAQTRTGFAEGAGRFVQKPVIIEGKVVAKEARAPAAFALGERVFHVKFGYGEVTEIDGNKLSVQFDKAGAKRVVASFVERV